jgi:hypothetical protein
MHARTCCEVILLFEGNNVRRLNHLPQQLVLDAVYFVSSILPAAGLLQQHSADWCVVLLGLMLPSTEGTPVVCQTASRLLILKHVDQL